MCHLYNLFSFGGTYLAQTLENVFTVGNPRDLRDSQDQPSSGKKKKKEKKKTPKITPEIQRYVEGFFLNKNTSKGQGRWVWTMEWA